MVEASRCIKEIQIMSECHLANKVVPIVGQHTMYKSTGMFQAMMTQAERKGL